MDVSYPAVMEPVTPVCFRPDGTRLLTGSGDGTTGVSEDASAEEVARLISCNDGKDRLVATPDGYFNSSPGGIKLLTLLRPGGNKMLSAVEKAKYYWPDLVERGLQGK